MYATENIFKLNSLKFIHLWQTIQLPCIFDNYFEFAKNKHEINIYMSVPPSIVYTEHFKENYM